MSPERDGARSAAVEAAVDVVDGAGVRWRVAERDARRDPGARGPRCLIFTSRHAVRRVWTYPRGWPQLPAEELLALSWER